MIEERKKPYLISYMVVGLIVLFIGCLTFAYLWIDRTISFTYLDASYRATEQAYTLVSALLEHEWLNLSEEEILRRLHAEADRYPQDKILIKHDTLENIIWFDNIRFEFQSSRLEKIQ